MIKYKNQYESYYSELRNKVDVPKVKKNANNDFAYSNNYYASKVSKDDNLGKRMVKKLVIQTLISAILFLSIVVTKYIQQPEIQKVYLFSKSLVEQDFKYEEFVEDLNKIGEEVKSVLNLES